MFRAEVVSVIAGGWSFKNVDHKKVPGLIIAVNDAGLRLEREDVAATVTMDRLWTENRWEELKKAGRGKFYARYSALQNIKDWKHESWVVPFDNADKPIARDYPVNNTPFSGKLGTLNGNSSGVCALNLAYQCTPRKLYIFGFDMCRSPSGDPYWYPPYAWTPPTGGTKDAKYNSWAKQFHEIAEHFDVIGCEVLNVSGHSRVRAFTQVTPKQVGMNR